jgi:DNA-nicking Smr family endonuclease
MTKDKKTKKLHGVNFDMEDDADTIFEDFLDNMGDIDKIDHSTPEPQKISAKKRSTNTRSESIDLHGLTLAQAVSKVDRMIAEILFSLKGTVTIKIITGKGIHSGSDGAVLPDGVWNHVRSTWAKNISQLEESPSSVKVAGLPIRGHFAVTLKN